MDWLKYKSKPETVRNGKHDGTRLVFLFSEDYKELFGVEPDISCPNCFGRDFLKFMNAIESPEKAALIKTRTMSKAQGKFRIKAMFEGIRITGTKHILSTLAMANDPDIALRFYVQHPHGAKLFDSVPKDVEEMVEAWKEAEAERVALAEKQAQEDAEQQAKESALRALYEKAADNGVEILDENKEPRPAADIENDIEAAIAKKGEAEKQAKAQREAHDKRNAQAPKYKRHLLKKMNRDQLDAIARGEGVTEPEKMANKDAVIAAMPQGLLS